MQWQYQNRYQGTFRSVVDSGAVVCRTALIALIVQLGCSGLATTVEADDDQEPAVEFNQDVRPILAEKCFRCHGPDSASRQADLRLDNKDAAFAERDGSRAIVPGKPSKSQVYLRITSSVDDERMPPVESGMTLSKQEIVTLRRWIVADWHNKPDLHGWNSGCRCKLHIRYHSSGAGWGRSGRPRLPEHNQCTISDDRWWACLFRPRYGQPARG